MNVTKNVTTVFAAIVVLVSMIAISSINNFSVFADPSSPQHISAGPPALPSFSAAATVLDDSFDRADNEEVGEGWVEIEQAGESKVSIANNQLFFENTSDGTNVPLIKRGFSQVSTGTLEWNFDFDWARIGNEKEYRFLMQLGDSAAMSDTSPDVGVGVNLIWSIIDNAQETLGSRAGGFNTALAVVRGPAHIFVVVDLGTKTYSVSVNDLEVGNGIPFDTDGPVDTVRFFTDQLHEQNISGRTIDELSIFSADAVPPVDAAPLAQDHSNITRMDTPRLVTLTATDPVECQLTFSIVTEPINGSVGVLTDQPCVAGGPNSDSAHFVYTPNAGFTGSDSFTWQANDGVDNSNDGIVSITIFQTTTLLSDTFDRPDSSAVGSDWIEVEPAGASAVIADSKLLFADTADFASRPLVKSIFPQVSDGALLWDFDFDWARTGPESNYSFLMQLGDSATMSDDSQNAGVGVNLVWTKNATIEQSLVYSKADVNTLLAVVSGPVHISVVADLSTKTYSVSVDDSEVGTDIPFDANVPLDTVRLFTDIVNDLNFAGRTIDNLNVSSTSTVNTPPAADAGPDQVGVQVGATVNLDGNGSSDDDGDPLTSLWSLTKVPAASTASLTGSMTANPSFVLDLEGIYQVELVVSDGLANSAPDTVTITTGSTVNTPPVADAGADQAVLVGAIVNLDGSLSSDFDSDPLNFLWHLTTTPPGSTASLTGPTTSNPSFVADLDGIYQVELVVNDGVDDGAPDTVSITAASSGNTPPVADAGADQAVLVGATVNLDGNFSGDFDGDLLTFLWKLDTTPIGSTASLTGPATSNPSFVADFDGIYEVELVVNDGIVDSAPDTVSITAASSGNTPPVADAGADQTVQVGATVNLDGNLSSDFDGDPLTFLWELSTTPIGSTASLTGPATSSPSFVADFDGIYEVELVVNDGIDDSAPDTVSITAVSTVNTPPVANAGPDQEDVQVGAVNLDGSLSSDFDGDPLTFLWKLTTTPVGSTASLTSPTTSGPSFVADLAGIYEVELVVNDGVVDSAPDTVSITAVSTVNTPPVADAGLDQEDVQVGATVNLDGSSSSDFDGDPLTFLWNLSTTPVGSTASLSDLSPVNPSFVADLAGIYEVELVVNDGVDDSAPDTVSITAAAGANILLSDNFDRPDDVVVGEGWSELQAPGLATVSIANNQLFFDNTSDVAVRPLVTRSFTPAVSTGIVKWDFDFDWTKTLPDSGYELWMQLGDSTLMVNPSSSNADRFKGVGVDLRWGNNGGLDERLVARQNGAGQPATVTPLAVISGPTQVSVTVDLAAQTYSVAINGTVMGSGLLFDDVLASKLDTVRFMTNLLDEVNFAGRTFDNVIVSLE